MQGNNEELLLLLLRCCCCCTLATYCESSPATWQIAATKYASQIKYNLRILKVCLNCTGEQQQQQLHRQHATCNTLPAAATNLINNRQTGRISCTTLNSTINYRSGQPAIIQIERLLSLLMRHRHRRQQRQQRRQQHATSATCAWNYHMLATRRDATRRITNRSNYTHFVAVHPVHLQHVAATAAAAATAAINCNFHATFYWRKIYHLPRLLPQPGSGQIVGNS